MIFLWHLVGLTVFCVGTNEAIGKLGSKNTTSRTFADATRGVDDPTRDRSWGRYIHQMKRLKLHEMKKTVRSRIRSEKFLPYIPIKQIRRILRLLELYDPEGIEVGYVKDASKSNAIHLTLSGQGILYVKITETDAPDREDQEAGGKSSARPIVLVVAGIGGSDWTAVHVTIHVVTNLVTSYEKKKLSGFDWWIIPLLNPDGYINSMSNKVRRVSPIIVIAPNCCPECRPDGPETLAALWKLDKHFIDVFQTRRYHPLNINPTGGCSGVNLDRNFLLQRASCRDGRRILECQQQPGEFPFSEVETRALRDFVSARAEDCKLFVAVKEGAKALVYPFASVPFPPPGAYTTLQDLLCVDALETFDESHGGTKNLFSFGSSGWFFGMSSGYVEDWTKRHMGIPRNFAFYITGRDRLKEETVGRLREYGKATLKVIRVLATSRRVERFAETFRELIKQTNSSKLSKPLKERPSYWGRELVHDYLRNKINRGAKLEMPIELMSDEKESRYDHLDF